MSLFFGAERRSITTADVPWGGGGGGFRLGSSTKQALRLIPLYAAVSSIADSIATTPLHGYEILPSGGSRRMAKQPSLVTSPGLVGTRVDWLCQLVASLLLRGNAYGLIVGTDAVGLPTKIIWLDPTHVVIDEQEVLPEYYYKGKLIPRHMLLHVPAFVLPGSIEGLSPLALFRLQITKGMAAQQFGADVFARGVAPAGILRNNEKIVTPTAAAIAKTRFRESVAGGDIFAVGKDWEWSALTVPNNDAVFLESIKATATEIAAIYRLAPEDIGGVSGGSLTYSTLEMNEIKRAQRALLPWTARIEAAVGAVLPPAQFIRFNLDATARAELKTRMEAHEIQLRLGLETHDEARATENRAPLTPEEAATWQLLFGTGEVTTEAQQARAVAELLQKSYLAVGKVITTEEARDLANKAGAGLTGVVDFTPAATPPPAREQ